MATGDHVGLGILVGRERELSELRVGLDAAEAGRGSLFIVVGEPGIGKTRLLDQIAAEARHRGMAALPARCWEGGGAPAFWPWVQVIRALVRTSSADLLTEPRGRAHITALVPELRDRMADLPQPSVPSPIEPDSARFALFDSTAAFFRAAAAVQPLAILLDDLHAADRPSLLLLQFLLRDLQDVGLLVVGSYRDVEARLQPELDAVLGDLSREGRHLPLRGLGPADVQRFIELAIGVAPAPDLVSVVHRVTDGNPFFLDEVVRLLAAEGRLASDGAPPPERFAIPAGVREAIRRRLAPLTAQCREVLEVASVVGREFDLVCLQHACELPAERVLEVVGEAARAGIVIEQRGAPGRWGFSHALVRDNLYDELPPVQRVTLHRRIGTVLEQLYASDLEPHLAELAHHFFAAAAGGDPSRAVAYAARAGERAMRLLAYEDAVSHYEQALRALGAGGAQQCQLLLALGEAQDRGGDTEAARRTFERAAEIARGLGDREALARAALGFGGEWALRLTAAVVDESLPGLLEEALAALGTDESALRAKVLGRLGLRLGFTGARDRGIRLSDEAVRMARRVGDAATLAYTLCNRHATLLGPDNLAERLEAADEILRLSEATTSHELALRGHAFRAYDLLELGDIAAVDRELDVHAQLAEELRWPFDLWWNVTSRVMRALLDGRFDDAARLSSITMGLSWRVPGRQAAADNVVMVFTAQQYLLRWACGGVEQFVPAVERSVLRYPAVPSWQVALAHGQYASGRHAEARRVFEHLAANEFAVLPRDAAWLGSMAALADICVAFGDRERAATIYNLLLPYAERNCPSGLAICLGAASRYLGLLASALSRLDAAGEHFENALAMNRRMGARPWLAHTQHDYAGMLLARALPGDHEKALGLLAEAGETARELGMTRLAAQAAELERHLGDSRANGSRAAVREPEVSEHLFRREGEYWTIAFGGHVVRLRDTRGLGCLGLLLRHPGREFHASELAVASRGGPTVPRQPGAVAREQLTGDAWHVTGRDNEMRVLDARARARYRERLAELREEVEDAKRLQDSARATRAEEEVEFLTRELVRDLGLGGRARRTGSPGERARLIVTKAIKASLTKITDHHPVLGQYLARTVRTGTFCSYMPEGTAGVIWTF